MAKPPDILIVNGLIKAGRVLSDPIDLTGGVLLDIVMPDEWTAANLTFQVSPNDTAAYVDLYAAEGWEVALSMYPGKAIHVVGAWVSTLRFIKLRSGHGDNPIVQEQDRTFGFWIVP